MYLPRKQYECFHVAIRNEVWFAEIFTLLKLSLKLKSQELKLEFKHFYPWHRIYDLKAVEGIYIISLNIWKFVAFVPKAVYW